MTDFIDIANTPITVELLGKEYKVRRVPLNTIFGKAESSVISLQLKRVHDMAAFLEGNDKALFLAKAMLESIPSGEKLNEMAVSFLKTPEGIKMVLVDALKRDQPDFEKTVDIVELLAKEDTKVATIVNFCTGRLEKEKSTNPLEVKAETPAIKTNQ